jgi:hypothetical protein
MSNAPGDKLRIGSLQAAMWRDLADRGYRYPVQLARGYQIDGGWGETGDLGVAGRPPRPSRAPGSSRGANPGPTVGPKPTPE